MTSNNQGLQSSVVNLIISGKGYPDLYAAVAGADLRVDLALAIFCTSDDLHTISDRIQWQAFDDSHLIYLISELQISWKEVEGLRDEIRNRARTGAAFNQAIQDTIYYNMISLSYKIYGDIKDHWIIEEFKLLTNEFPEPPFRHPLKDLMRSKYHESSFRGGIEEFYLERNSETVDQVGHPYFDFDVLYEQGQDYPQNLASTPLPIEFYEGSRRLGTGEIPISMQLLDPRLINNRWVNIDTDKCWEYVKYNVSRIPDRTFVKSLDSEWVFTIAAFFFRLEGNESKFDEMYSTLDSLTDRIIFDWDDFRYWSFTDIQYKIENFKNAASYIIPNEAQVILGTEMHSEDYIKFPNFINFNTSSYKMILDLLKSDDPAIVESALDALMDIERLEYCPERIIEVYRNHSNPTVRKIVDRRVKMEKDQRESDSKYTPMLSEIIISSNVTDNYKIPATDDRKIAEYFLLLAGIGSFDDYKSDPDEFEFFEFAIEDPKFNHYIKRICAEAIESTGYKNDKTYSMIFNPTQLALGDVIMLSQFRRMPYAWMDPRLPPDLLIQKTIGLTEEARKGEDEYENWDIKTSLLLRNPSLPVRHKNIFNKRLNPLTRRFIHKARVPR